MRVLRWLVAIAVVALAVYTVYVGYEGSSQALAVDDERGAKRYCFTPEMYAGWEYEAVNYDIAQDATLPHEPDADPYDEDCGDLRGTAGDEIVTPDGIAVAAWYIPAEADIGPDGPTILLAHGNPANKSDMLRYAQYLHPDFNLVVPDFRNSGRSSGTMSTTGVLEYQEVIAVIDWLVEEKRPTEIGALGDSGGAAAILRAAAAGEDRIDAFVTDSAHATLSETIAHALTTEANPPHPRYPALWAIQAGYWIRTGHGIDEADPVKTVAAIGARSYLLLHGTADHSNHPEASAELIHAAALEAGVPVTMQYCQGGTHGNLPRDCADSYAEWVVPFFTDALASAG